MATLAAGGGGRARRAARPAAARRLRRALGAVRAADFRGCAFINTIVEAADPESPAHAVADEHKRRLTGYLVQLLAEAGHADPETMAARLVLLVDGAIVTALRERSPAAAQVARGIAEVLLLERAPAASTS
jgi:hypothetical protein